MHPAPAAPRKKTAVVVIHGMGEQRPMDTIWGFVEAVWVRDADLTSDRTRPVYSKPDNLSRSFELRRITTRNVPLEGGVAKRVDFFEFYWAHLMTGNTVAGFTAWLFGLLFRRPSSVPGRLFLPWLVALLLTIVTLLLLGLVGLQAAKVPLVDSLLGGVPAWLLAGFSAVASFVASRWLAPIAGDAARYLSPDPDNVAARQSIRETGVKLLRSLTLSGRYDRIVVVGHSLGSVVAYDVLNFAWGSMTTEKLQKAHGESSPAMEGLADLELAAGALRHAPADQIGTSRVAYRTAQRAYQATLAAGAAPIWLVSDLVTVGSPLSKADVLLARDAAALDRKKALREVPSAPPWLEKDSFKQKKYRFSFPANHPVRVPHNGAVFAPVVWTNVYFPSVLLAFGDFISGSVSGLFGRGVLDVRVPIGGLRFRHTHYWREPESDPARPWLRALRRAVNLRGRSEAELWGEQATAAEVEAGDLPT
jgi:hypothetical protein